jgi:G3E family GTPase
VIENEFGEVSIDDALLEEGQVSLKATGTEVRPNII